MNMTDDDVLAALALHADPGALAEFRVFQMRYDVVNGRLPSGHVLYTPVACADGNFMAVSFTMEEGSNVPRWVSVQGPMTLDDLKELARA